MNKKRIFMSADEELLKTLKSMKMCKKESYAEVVKRLIDKERRLKS